MDIHFYNYKIKYNHNYTYIKHSSNNNNTAVNFYNCYVSFFQYWTNISWNGTMKGLPGFSKRRAWIVIFDSGDWTGRVLRHDLLFDGKLNIIAATPQRRSCWSDPELNQVIIVRATRSSSNPANNSLLLGRNCTPDLALKDPARLVWTVLSSSVRKWELDRRGWCKETRNFRTISWR